MSENKYGLDVRYHGTALKSIVNDIEWYTPDELYRALTRIISVIPSEEKESLQQKLAEANERVKVLEELAQSYLDNYAKKGSEEFLFQLSFKFEDYFKALEASHENSDT